MTVIVSVKSTMRAAAGRSNRSSAARGLAAISVGAALAALLAACGGSAAAGRDVPNAGRGAPTAGGGPCERHLAGVGVHGRFAFIRNRGISILDLPSCRTHVLLARSDAGSPLRFSGSGRYLAYGDGEVIVASGTPTPRAPLGKLRSWAWSPNGDELAGVSRSGGLSLWRPGGRTRRLIAAGWGATDVAFSPRAGLLALTRSTRESHGVSRQNQLWTVDPATGQRRLIYSTEGVGELGSGIAGFTPDGSRVLLWPNPTGSASLAEDGLPLVAVPIEGGRPRTLVKKMLAYRDYIATCRSSVVVAGGPLRESNIGKSLELLAPHSDRASSLHLSGKQSWTAPSCSQNGKIATAAGPSRSEPHFGLEHRSIWLLPSATARPRRLTAPGPRSITDELPRISRHGRYVLYIRTDTKAGAGLGESRGSLWAVAVKQAHAKPIGPIAQLGTQGSYYGHYGWTSVTAWHQG